jgi:uncharacterized membrane protein YwaF
MGNEMFVTTIAGFIACVVLLILSFRAGRSTPTNKVLWVIALVLLGISIALRFTFVIGGVLNEQATEVLPILIGNAAVIGAFVAAFWQPRLTGWFLIGSAIVMPLLTIIAETTVRGGFPEETMAAVMVGSYSIPSIITGTLLVLSMKQSDSGSRHTQKVASMPL